MAAPEHCYNHLAAIGISDVGKDSKFGELEPFSSCLVLDSMTVIILTDQNY
jgi:hypothetical protein